MPINEVLSMRYKYWEAILDRKHWIEYLQPGPYDVRELKEIFTKAHTGVIQLIEEHAKAYMTQGKDPPAAIAGVVLNFADSVASGSVPVLRAGDYISAKNFMKQQK